MPFIDDSLITTLAYNRVITSTIKPSIPSISDTWNQIDADGNLIEKWEAIDNPDYQWRSTEKRSLTEQPYQLSLSSSNRQYFLGINNISYDAIIKEFILNYAVLNQLTSTQTVTCDLQRVIENGVSFAYTSLDTTVISNMAANRFFKKTTSLNYLYKKDSALKTGFRLLITAASGTSINLIFQANLIYYNYQ